MPNFLFIRHGQTSWGPQDISKGPLDLELNETGYEQANSVYKIIKNNYGSIINPLIFSSDLKRTYQTAQILATNIDENLIVTLYAGLRERYYGDFSKCDSNIPEYIPPDAESLEDFEKRVVETLLDILNEQNQLIIIVSHQKVFGVISKLLTNKELRLDQGGVCFFKCIDDKYTAHIYGEKVNR
jgi:broad specificity phosphatase PhoE